MATLVAVDAIGVVDANPVFVLTSPTENTASGFNRRSAERNDAAHGPTDAIRSSGTHVRGWRMLCPAARHALPGRVVTSGNRLPLASG